jgi:uncharacterized MAPEG superfamily protein
VPIEIKVLGYAALLQFVQYILMAVPVNFQMGVAYTGGNRDEQRQPTGIPGRLKRALDNHFEALIMFSIVVFVVVAGEASSSLTEACAWIYLWARVLYIPAYVSGIFLLRSAVWSVGFLATAVMLIVALL